MKTSQEGINLIKQHESLKLNPYLCPAKKWTIGYGHVILPHEKFIEITEAQAEELLKQDLVIAENCINSSLKAPITQNEFDALVSLSFNIGITAFRKSTLLAMINNETSVA
jgi:lysozyme